MGQQLPLLKPGCAKTTAPRAGQGSPTAKPTQTLYKQDAQEILETSHKYLFYNARDNLLRT